MVSTKEIRILDLEITTKNTVSIMSDNASNMKLLLKITSKHGRMESFKIKNSYSERKMRRFCRDVRQSFQAITDDVALLVNSGPDINIKDVQKCMHEEQIAAFPIKIAYGEKDYKISKKLKSMLEKGKIKCCLFKSIGLSNMDFGDTGTLLSCSILDD